MVTFRYSRYSDEMLRGLGICPDHRGKPDFIPNDKDAQELVYWFKGDFGNIIDTIFDGSPVNLFDKLTSTNTPDHVKNFINNFLMKRIQSVPSSMSDDEAFASIIPRRAQTSAELQPYLGRLKDIVSDFRKSHSSPKSNASEDKTE